MAGTSSIISISSASLFTPTTPQPKTHCLLKHTKDNDHLPPSSFTTLSSLRISKPKTTTRVNVPPRTRRLSCSASASSSSTLPSALLFDCDGVLVDTEKDGHRISFNQTFQEVLIQTLIASLFSLTNVLLLCLCFYHAEKSGRYMGCGLVWRIAQNWRWKRKVWYTLTFTAI